MNIRYLAIIFLTLGFTALVAEAMECNNNNLISNKLQKVDEFKYNNPILLELLDNNLDEIGKNEELLNKVVDYFLLRGNVNNLKAKILSLLPNLLSDALHNPKYATVALLGFDEFSNELNEAIRSKIDNENAYAQNNLGYLYHRGFVHRDGAVEKPNPAKAFLFYEKAAQQGLPIALANLALMYYKGYQKEDGTREKRDAEKAIELLKRAADKGLLMAERTLAVLYQSGWLKNDGSPETPDPHKAFSIIEKLADEGDASSQYLLGNFYAGTRPTTKEILAAPDRAKAVVWLQKSADQGNDLAQKKLADFYKTGWINSDGTCQHPDMEFVVFWLRKSAANKNTEALLELCYFYQKGFLKKDGSLEAPDLAEAAELLKQAAHQGSAGKNALGLMYLKGWVKKDQTWQAADFDQARILFQSAAQQNNIHARFNLAELYLTGWQKKDGSDEAPDPDKAVLLLEQAGNSGLAPAINRLIKLYQSGWQKKDGTIQICDIDKKVFWLQKSADRGNVNDQYHLGGRYQSGWQKKDGSWQAPNEEMAAHYYQRAAEQGPPEAANDIGFMYQKGWQKNDGSFQHPDNEKAFYYYQIGAEKGSKNSLNNLGFMYQHGLANKGKVKNPNIPKALELYYKAARLGSFDAALNIDYIYENKLAEDNKSAAARFYASYFSTLKWIQENSLAKAWQFFEVANYWKEDWQNYKILALRIKFAECYFKNEAYAEALTQYHEIDRMNGQLDLDAMIMKFLCLIKLGCCANIQQFYEDLCRENDWLNKFIEYFKHCQKHDDHESAIVIFKLMKNIAKSMDRNFYSVLFINYLDALIKTYQQQEFRFEAEAFLNDNNEDDIPSIGVICRLIVEHIKSDENDKFNFYMNKYILSGKIFILNTAYSDEIKFSNSYLITQLFQNDWAPYKNYLIRFCQEILRASFPVSSLEMIFLCTFLASADDHKSAYQALKKILVFHHQGVKFSNASNGTELNLAHEALKKLYLPLFLTLHQEGSADELHAFALYLIKRHGIPIGIINLKNNKKKQSEKMIIKDTYKKLISNFITDSQKNIDTININMNKLRSISLQIWSKLPDIDSISLIEKADILHANCLKSLDLIENYVAKSYSIEEFERARQAREQFVDAVQNLNNLIQKPLHLASVIQKQEKFRKHLPKYIINNESTLTDKEPSGTESSLIALEAEEKVKNAIERKKARKAARLHLQQKYEEKAAMENENIAKKDVPLTTLLTEYEILPAYADDYTQKHYHLLLNILTDKFDLGVEAQETLRVILTGGERSFQITLEDIKKLFANFEGYMEKMHHGSNHEKISGLGLTLMPNADGVKKGSYKGQLLEAKGKIITIIAKDLSLADLEEHSEG